MIKLARLSPEGVTQFRAWLAQNESGIPPAELLGLVEETYDADVDETKTFQSRYEFGMYLCHVLGTLDFMDLMSGVNDGAWAWLALVYYKQLAPKKHKRAEHYIVTRTGPKGSLAYRHAVRTSFEMVYIHGETAKLCLAGSMKTWGEMAEQLTSRQNVAHNKAFFEAAAAMYVRNGALARGAGTKPKKPGKRKSGDKAGYGGVRRLALALQRLDLTYDTEAMEATKIVPLLPKEFGKWKLTSAGAAV